MKKILAVFLAVIMVLTITACERTAIESRDDVEDKDQKAKVEDRDRKEKEDDEESNDDEKVSLDITEPEETSSKKPDFGPLSDDLSSFQVEINNEVYQFPVKYPEFISYGWHCSTNESELIQANSFSLLFFSMGDLECMFDVVNFDINARKLSECYVAGINIRDYDVKGVKDFKLRLPKGIEFGKSTIDEVKEAYGKPDEFYDGDSYIRTEYRFGSYQYVKFEFDKDTGIINEIIIVNFAEPDDFEKSEMSTEVPEFVKNYKDPEKLSSDFSDFVIRIEGDLYKLPVPVSTFIAKGWILENAEPDDMLPGSNTKSLRLKKGKKRISLGVKNYLDMATILENCLAYRIDIFSSSDADFVISNNIKNGMDQKSLENALKDVEYDKMDDPVFSTISYHIEYDLFCRYSIGVNKETGKVEDISIEKDNLD